jgi:hypothetical protein
MTSIHCVSFSISSSIAVCDMKISKPLQEHLTWIPCRRTFYAEGIACANSQVLEWARHEHCDPESIEYFKTKKIGDFLARLSLNQTFPFHLPSHFAGGQFEGPDSGINYLG